MTHLSHPCSLSRISPLLLVLLLAMTCQSRASDVFPVDRQFFPYYPSLLRYPPPQAEFNPPEVCAECHSRQYEEWTSSVHALAFVDPIYQGELNLAVKAVGHEISRQCEGCHSPAGVVTGEVSGAGLGGLSPMALAGVSCDICHSVSAVTHCQTPSREPENGSMVLTPGVVRDGQIVLQKHGPNPTTELCGMEFHDCAESPLHLRADLCASCHQVYHYESHFPLEATYLEWKHGPYAQRDILCQDCHMVDIETFRRSADRFIKPEHHEYHHYFNGANFLLYFLAAQHYTLTGDLTRAENAMDKYRMAIERLQAAAGLELLPVYRSGQLSAIKVRVKNLRAGHNLPTSLTNVRQMWLELTATDAAGQVLVSSGYLDAKGELEAQTRNLNSDGMGDNFHFAIDPWTVTAFSRHDTIPPRGYKDVHFGLVPAAIEGEVQVAVRLRYRQASQKLAEKLLGAVPDDIDLEKTYGLTSFPKLPVVDMTQATARFPAIEGD